MVFTTFSIHTISVVLISGCSIEQHYCLHFYCATTQAQLMVSEAARANLQAQVERRGRTSGGLKIGVDTRNLGRLSQFNGTDSAWRDWSVVFCSYAALVHPALKDEMQRVQRMSTQKPMRDLSKVNRCRRVATFTICFCTAPRD